MHGTVKHRATPKFWQAFNQLPEATQRLARDAFEKLKNNPKHPSLHLKKVGRFWSARVGLHHRALAVENESDLIWFWIGSHAEYDRLIQQ